MTDYPCPLVSVRQRKPVFGEIGHTIMNLLVDFRNFQYQIPHVRGFSIYMKDKTTYLNLPKNRYEDVSHQRRCVVPLFARWCLNLTDLPRIASLP